MHSKVSPPFFLPRFPVRGLQLGIGQLFEVPLEVLLAVAEKVQGDGGVGKVVGLVADVLDEMSLTDGVPKKMEFNRKSCKSRLSFFTPAGSS